MDGASTARADAIREALRCGRRGCSCMTARGNSHCVAHDDRTPSLSVTESDGLLLVYCHAGCAQDAVIAELRRRGCWGTDGRPVTPPTPPPSAKSSQPADQRLIETYDYRDVAGTLVFQVRGFEPKDFRQRRPDGTGGWIHNLDGIPRPLPLYRLPELLARTGTSGWFSRKASATWRWRASWGSPRPATRVARASGAMHTPSACGAGGSRCSPTTIKRAGRTAIRWWPRSEALRETYEHPSCRDSQSRGGCGRWGGRSWRGCRGVRGGR